MAASTRSIWKNSWYEKSAITLATVGCAHHVAPLRVRADVRRARVARTLAGATAGALIPLSLAWIGDTVAYERRQAVLARFLIGQMFGIAMGQVLGGLGADHFGERPVFLALAAWFAARAALLMWRFAPQRESAARSDARRRSAELRAPCSTCAWARVVLLTVFVEGILLVGALAFVPTHLHRVYDMPLTLAGAIVDALRRRRPRVRDVVAGARAATAARPGLAAGGGRADRHLLRVDRGGARRRCGRGAGVRSSRGLGFYMLHNTLQVNAT